MINIVICDDEVVIAEQLGEMTSQILNGACRIRLFESAFAAETYICDEARGEVDILIMDICLPDDSGIALCKRLKLVYPNIKLIFISGYIEYALEIFDAEPIYFLGKPVSKEKLERAVKYALRMIEDEKNDYIIVRNKGEILRVRIKSILYMESALRVVMIHESGHTHRVYGKLNDFERMLPSYFLRCHQSYMVNLNKVRMLKENHFLLFNGEKTPISHQKYKEIKQAFLQYLSDSI